MPARPASGNPKRVEGEPTATPSSLHPQRRTPHSPLPSSRPLPRHTRYKLDISAAGKNYNRIRRAITSGFFTNAAKKDPTEGYRTMVEGQPVYIHPSSALFNRNPDWVRAVRAACGTLAVPAHGVVRGTMRRGVRFVRGPVQVCTGVPHQCSAVCVGVCVCVRVCECVRVCFRACMCG
jgi:hypothetical protein